MYTKIECFKGDFDNHLYPLKNCEITLYTDPLGKNIATDLNGNPCVGLSDANGKVNFEVYDTNFETGGLNKYYYSETKAPFGYKKINGVFRVQPTPSLNDAMLSVATLMMFDKIIIIPPKAYPDYLMNPFDTNQTIAGIFTNYSNGVYFGDSVVWWYYDNNGQPTLTPSGGRIPGHYVHVQGDIYTFVTEMQITWKSGRILYPGDPVPVEYRDIFYNNLN